MPQHSQPGRNTHQITGRHQGWRKSQRKAKNGVSGGQPQVEGLAQQLEAIAEQAKHCRQRRANAKIAQTRGAC